jgi:hypothetical protein
MKHQDYQDMLALHALSALDGSDLRVMEEHLVSCSTCREELEGWRDTAGALAHAGELLEPSPQVRARILEGTRSAGKVDASSSNVLPLQSRPRQAFWVPRYAAIAASLLFVALLVGWVILWQQNRRANRELARLSAQYEQAQRDRERNQKLLEILNSPGARVAELVGTNEAPAAHAVLTYDAKSGQAILMTNGLPPAPAGKAYQLWFIVGNLPMPGRVFSIEPNGTGVSSEQLPLAAAKTAGFAITQESAAGATSPTGPILLRSSS